MPREVSSGRLQAASRRVWRRQGRGRQSGRCVSGPWALVEPRDNPVDIDGGGDRDVLQVGLRQAPIPGPAQPKGADPLRERPFDAGASLILLPGPPRWHTRSAPLASASYWSLGRQPQPSARVLGTGTARRGRDTAHTSCLANSTMMGRLPCPPPCSHHAADTWPWGQRTCCWSQSTANCSRVYAPSTCVCQPWLGRVGPRRMMPCSSRLWTSSSELI